MGTWNGISTNDLYDNQTTILSNQTNIEADTNEILDNHDVPAKDVATNLLIRDVVGNKTDGHNGTSLYSLGETLNEHAHAPSKIMPDLADGIVVVDGAGAWTLGALTELAPASSITSDFDIHYILFTSLSAVDEYQLNLYYGASDTFAGSVCAVRTANQDTNSNIAAQTIVVPANSRIRCRLASSTGGRNASVKLFYHEY